MKIDECMPQLPALGPRADTGRRVCTGLGRGGLHPSWSLRNVKRCKRSDALFPCARAAREVHTHTQSPYFGAAIAVARFGWGERSKKREMPTFPRRGDALIGRCFTATAPAHALMSDAYALTFT